jgi:hypothetical protein
MKKKYLPMFARYNVILRQTNATVYHPYRGSIEVNPLQFALFETAIKAIDAHYQALIRTRFVPQSRANTVNIVVSPDGASTPGSDADWLASYEKARRWHREIAERHSFALEELNLAPEAAYADYGYCCKELGQLYYDLLD